MSVFSLYLIQSVLSLVCLVACLSCRSSFLSLVCLVARLSYRLSILLLIYPVTYLSYHLSILLLIYPEHMYRQLSSVATPACGFPISWPFRV
jgi:hypothetical protein